MSDVQLHLGDCLEILPTLEAGSVDAVITDPPYGIGYASDAYTYYDAIMVWPDEEEREHGYRIDFEIEFRNCVVYTP